jgi:hypothetical protein
MKYPRRQQGRDRSFIICCENADEEQYPAMFIEVTTVHETKTYALCAEHTPDLSALPVLG